MVSAVSNNASMSVFGRGNDNNTVAEISARNNESVSFPRMTIQGGSRNDRSITGAPSDERNAPVNFARISHQDTPYTKAAAYQDLKQKAYEWLLGKKANVVLTDNTPNGEKLAEFAINLFVLGKEPGVADTDNYGETCNKLKSAVEAYKKDGEKGFSTTWIAGSPDANKVCKRIEKMIDALVNKNKGVFDTAAGKMYEILDVGLPKVLAQRTRLQLDERSTRESALGGNATDAANEKLLAQLNHAIREGGYAGLTRFINTMLNQLDLGADRAATPAKAAKVPDEKSGPESGPDKWPRDFVKGGGNYNNQTVGDTHLHLKGLLEPLISEFKALRDENRALWERLLSAQNLGPSSASASSQDRGTDPLPLQMVNAATNTDAEVRKLDGRFVQLEKDMREETIERSTPPSKTVAEEAKTASWPEGASERGAFRNPSPQLLKSKNPESPMDTNDRKPKWDVKIPQPVILSPGSPTALGGFPVWPSANAAVTPLSPIPPIASLDSGLETDSSSASSTGNDDLRPAWPDVNTRENKPKKKVTWWDSNVKPGRDSLHQTERPVSLSVEVAQPVAETKQPTNDGQNLTFELKRELMPKSGYMALNFNGSVNKSFFAQVASGIQGLSGHENELKKYIKEGKNPAEAQNSKDETEKRIHETYDKLKKQSAAFADHLERLFKQYYGLKKYSSVGDRVVLSPGSPTAPSGFPSRADVG